MSVGQLNQQLKKIEQQLTSTKNKLNSQSQQLITSCHFVHSKLQLLELNLHRHIHSLEAPHISSLDSFRRSLIDQNNQFEKLFSDFWSADQTLTQRVFINKIENLFQATHLLLSDIECKLATQLNKKTDVFDKLNQTTDNFLKSLVKLADHNWLTNCIYSGLSLEDSTVSNRNMLPGSLAVSSESGQQVLFGSSSKIDTLLTRFQGQPLIFMKLVTIDDFYVASRSEFDRLNQAIRHYCDDPFLTSPLIEQLKVDDQVFVCSR